MKESLEDNKQIEDISESEKKAEEDIDISKESEHNEEPIISTKEELPENNSPGAIMLRNWLNKTLRVEMSDGRILMGVFLCTDRDANIILGSCSEYLPGEDECSTGTSEEPRVLGLVMVPGKHIVTICIDQIDAGNELLSDALRNANKSVNTRHLLSKPLTENIDANDLQ